MRWLLTGGCGFIGTNLIARLAADPGQAIRVLDNLSVGQRADLATVAPFTEQAAGAPGETWSTGVELRVADLRDGEALAKALQGAEVVVHLAAATGVLPSVEDPAADFDVNVRGTFALLDAARQVGVRSLVFASSGAPMGDRPPPFHEEVAPRPLSPYGASKLAGEGYCQAFAGSYGLPTTVLRFSNVYGPRSQRKASVVAKFISQALRGETLQVYGDGSQTRDFIYVADLCAAIVAAAQQPQRGEVFQIATQRETTLTELVALLGALLREEAGVDCQVEQSAWRTGEVRRNFAEISKAERLLGWRPEHSLEQGLRETVRWFCGRPSPS